MRDGGDLRPPRVLEWICGATLPHRQREAVLGDLFEDYAERASGSGRRAAGRGYAREILRSLGPTVSSLPSYLLSARRYRGEDVVTMAWFALVAVLVAVFLAASGVRPR